jgi:hypothetical protein
MTNKEKNISSIEKAVVELQSIVENAEKSAKDKLAKQLPEKFETLIKEELEDIKNNKKESVEESVKDVTKEPVNEGKKTDDDKESLNEMEEIDLSELSIEDIEEAYNEASSTDEFEVSPDDINIDDIESELEEMQSMNDEIDMQKEGDNPSDPFDQIKNLHKMLGEMIQDNEMTNEMHDKVPRGATAPADKGHNTTPAGINEANLDEAVDPAALQAIGGALGVLAAGGGLAALQQWLKQKNPKVAAALEQMGSAAGGGIKGGVTSEGMMTEEEIVEEESHEGEEEIDETAGSQKGHAINRTVGNENLPTSSPRKDSTQRAFQREGVEKTWSNESVQKFITQKETMEKRMNSLIEENKKMTKKLNESKAEQKKHESLLEEQAKIKDTLVKYRDQLSEMAIFNTNLFGVNRILVNEELALTSEDKKAIVDRFKNVKSITESEKTYETVLNEMQSAKKTITESVEEKVTDSIDKSSSEKVVEQTAYVNEHVDKIKNLMNYVDNHGNSRILR